MNPDVKKKWLAALLTENYSQGSGALCSINRDTGEKQFCCLGVLCDIAVRENILKEPVPDIYNSTSQVNAFMWYGNVGGRESKMYLPNEVRIWAGLEQSDPVVPVDINLVGQYDRDEDSQDWTTLAQLNDNGVSFDKLSRIINEYL